MTPITEMTNEQLDRMIAEKRLLEIMLVKMTNKHDAELATKRLLEGAVRPYTTDPRYAFELLEEMRMDLYIKQQDGVDLWKVNGGRQWLPDAKRAIAERYAEWRGGE